MNPDDTIIVVNKGTEPLIDFYAKRKFTMRPGVETFIPYGAACIWFGNPASRNTPTRPEREEEVKRLMFRYGKFKAGGVTEYVIPDVDLFELAPDGTRPQIWTVVQDPTGERALVTENTTAGTSETDVLKNQIIELQRQQLALTQAFVAQGGNLAQVAPIVPGAVDGDASGTHSLLTTDDLSPAPELVGAGVGARPVDESPATVDGPTREL